MQDKLSIIAGKALLLCAFAFTTALVSAQTQIEKFVPGSTLEGVSYYLPRTAFRMIITAEKTVVTPGKFHNYAYKYLRIQDVPVHTSTTWQVKNIELIPFGTPDQAKAYSIKLKPRTVAPLVSLTTDGILLGINTQVTETALPPLSKSKIVKRPISHADVDRYMTPEMIQAGSSAKVAELIAQTIYDIRESRDLICRGEADNTPKDGQQLKLMLDNLDIQQTALASLFVGTSEVSEHTYAIDIVPAQATDRMLLFRFSKWTGLVDADDLSGEPYYLSIKTLGELPQQSLDASIEVKKGKMQSAVYYNVPANCEINIFSSTEKFVEMKYPIAQLGYAEILSGILFDKRPNTKVSFFQSTGGIKEIKADELN